MANVKLGTKAVGSVLKLNLNGSPKNFIVVHQGKPSSLYDDSCDGTWVLMQDIHSTRQWDGSNNDYKNSDIHSWLNGTFLNLFDANIREAPESVRCEHPGGHQAGKDPVCQRHRRLRRGVRCQRTELQNLPAVRL